MLCINIFIRRNKLMKYVCDVCGWEYDEEEGYPEGGIAPGTKWACSRKTAVRSASVLWNTTLRRRLDTSFISAPRSFAFRICVTAAIPLSQVIIVSLPSCQACSIRCSLIPYPSVILFGIIISTSHSSPRRLSSKIYVDITPSIS